MNPLADLLREFGADEDLIALAERWSTRETDGVEALTDDELATLIAGLISLGEEDEAGIGLLEAAADTAVEVRTEQATRVEAAEQEDRDAEAARARLRGDEPEASDTDPETPPDGDGDEPDPATPPDDDETVVDPAERPVTEPAEAVTASGRADLRSLARRQSRQSQPVVEDSTARATLTFAANAPYDAGPDSPVAGRPVAADRTNLHRLSVAMQRSIESLRRAGNGMAEIRLATITANYPEDRRLVDGDGNMLSPSTMGRIVGRVLERHGTPQAITAAGGLCGPLQPFYGVDVIGDDRRPIRDEALVGFQATRGGLISMTPPLLPQLAGSVGIWDMDMDAAAASDPDVVKVKMRIECGDDVTTRIKAITARLVIGNMIARTYGEWVQAWSDLQLVAQARVAETELLAQMKAGSVVTDLQTTEVSAVRDTLNALNRIAWTIRSRHRVLRDFPFRVILPELWLAIAAEDISKGLPGGSVDDNLTVAYARIQNWFTSRMLNVTWTPDLNVQGAIGDSDPAPQLPPSVEFAVYPEGAWLHLGQPDMNLGVTRDTGTNDRNDYETFSETFEAAHRLAAKEMSVWGSLNVCPSGAVNGTLDPAGECASYT